MVSPDKYSDLPVSKQRETILAALKKHQIVVVVGDTGSGKTTQLPKMALEYLASLKHQHQGIVGCTQPRRIAAASVSKRVAEELQVIHGQEVGYQVRFEDTCSKNTVLKFMTDGILLAETQADRNLKKYAVLIVDEVHERSLNIDFLLGYLKNIIKSRKDLRLIISSATLNAGAFSEFFDHAPIIEVEGRTYPVETYYLPADHEYQELTDQVAEACKWVRTLDQEGDILVFLPGEREIRECAEVLTGKAWSKTEILPLFARIGLAEQQRVFQTRAGIQRIVLATNVAETSITIPGIVYVIDSGLARVSRWNPSRQVQRLQVEKISQASAKQRKGRCGRVREGVCVRLYEEEDYGQRNAYTDPEIRRSSLAGVILRMKALKLPEINEFPFIDPPSSKHVNEGYRTLKEIGALCSQHRMKKLGYQIASLSIEPRMAKMLLEAVHFGCLSELLVIVSGLSVMDPRERPQGKEQQASQAQVQWCHQDSDFLSILLLWMDIDKCRSGKKIQRNALRKLCKLRFLNFRRILEWDNLLYELTQQCKRALKFEVEPLGKTLKQCAHPDVIHKAILAGIPRQIGLFDQKKKIYRGGQGREFSIFPGSVLFSKKKVAWILAYELVDTSKLWARRNAVLMPQWLEEVASHLLRKSWHSPFYNKSQGAVYAKEVVSLGNLTLVADRKVHFGRINPQAAKEIFIREAILAGKLKSKNFLLEKVSELRLKIADAEQRLRRVDGIWAEELLFQWFDEHLPVDCHTAKAFIQWTSKTNSIPSVEDVCHENIEDLGIEEFPEYLIHDDHEYPLYYKVAPGQPDDGITIGIHIDALAQFPEQILSWGVVGNIMERVQLLIKTLPKSARIACNPVREKAVEFKSSIRPNDYSEWFSVKLAAFLTRSTGRSISADLFQLERLPEFMNFKVWVYDDEGYELGFGKDLGMLKRQLSGLLKDRFEESSSSEWEYSEMSSFACKPLPLIIEKTQGKGYPALVDEGRSVAVKVFAEAIEAHHHHRKGLIRLFLLEHGDHAKYISKSLSLSVETQMYLPLLGSGGVDHADIMRWIVELGLGQNLPRDAEAYGETAVLAKANLYEASQRVCAALEEIVELYREVELILPGWKKDTNLAEVAEDIGQQVEWLFRQGFASQADVWFMLDYSFWLKAVRERIGRVQTLPLLKDLTKMDELFELWQPWYEYWIENQNDLRVINIGYQLNHLRSCLFAPGMKPQKKVSKKVILKSLEDLGIQ